MKRTHERNDSSDAPENDHKRSKGLSKQHTGTEITTIVQETIQNLGHTDNQNLLLQQGTSSQLEIDAHKPDMFSCEVCTYQTKNMSEYIDHKQTHGKSYNFKCPTCKKVFKNKGKFVKHMQVNHNDKESKNVMFSCNVCPEMFKNQLSLNIHYDTVHNLYKDIKYRCDQCAFSTNSKSHLNGHKKTHVDISDFQGTVCGRKFKEQLDLKSHYSDTHMQDVSTPEVHDSSLPCKLYIQASKTKDSCKQYNKSKHPTVICEICSQQLPTVASLKKHLLVHNIKDAHICSTCYKLCKTKKSLNTHIEEHKKRIHLASNKTRSCDSDLSVNRSKHGISVREELINRDR